MSKRIYTQEQLKQLERNVNVARCSERSITYSTAFKRRAIKQYHEQGFSSRAIFEKAGFDLTVIGKKTPKECFSR